MRTGAEAAAIAVSRIGTPFKHLSGNPPGHQVLGRTTNGERVTVADLEMVMNDANSIDECHGVGSYAEITKKHDAFSHEVLPLAIKLYGCQPIDLHKTEAS